MAGELSQEDVNDVMLPSQYNDLVRRRAPHASGEYRLLWAVLEDAIRSFLANCRYTNRTQYEKFREADEWLHALPSAYGGLFEFNTICELLEIDRDQLLKGLNALARRKYPRLFDSAALIHERVAAA